MFRVIHRCRREGLSLAIEDNDAFEVVDAMHFVLVVLDGSFVRRLIQHHLDGAALTQRVTDLAQRPIPSPYRRPLAPPLPTEQERRALARRSRKRKGES